jgi:hypothetical protein
MVTEECRQFMQAIDLVQTEAGKRLIDHETEVIVAVRKLFLYKAFKNKRELAQELKQFSGMSGCVNLGRLVPRIRNLLNKYTPMEINEHIALIQVYISEAQRISSSSVMNIGNY